LGVAWSLFPGDVAYIWHAGSFCADATRMLPESDPGTLAFEALRLESLGRGDRRGPDQ
jgi:hypothetical protein